jgi:hypothetical protein
MEKVAPSERFRSELDEVLAGVSGEEDPIETVGRLGARLILQQALEDEVTEFLGRGRYERSDETVSHRNGYEQRTVKTTSGFDASGASQDPRCELVVELVIRWIGHGGHRAHHACAEARRTDSECQVGGPRRFSKAIRCVSSQTPA